MLSTSKTVKAAEPPFVITNPRQIAALKAASRQEIMDVLAPMGTVSIAELAAALGRPADSLYYHVRILQKVGLMLAAGTRESNGRTEKLYRAVASDLRLAYVPGRRGNAKGITAIIDSMLRLTSRDFKDAFADEATVVEGAHRELWAARTTGWLTQQQLAELNARMTEMLRTNVTSLPGGTERLFALTMVLTPLQRSGGTHDG